MPSLLHQVLVRLFEERPDMLRTLLRGTVDISTAGTLRPSSLDLTDLIPAQRTADNVLVVQGPHTSLLGLVFEVHLQKNAAKRIVWACYTVNLQAKRGCPVALVILAPRADVAEWARTPIDLGFGSRIVPIVLGPEQIPEIVDRELALLSPELAIVSALTHNTRLDVALAALEAATSLDEARARIYTDSVMACAAPDVRAQLEDLMATGSYEFQSDFAKKYIALGREEGRAEGLRLALLSVLRHRGIELAEEEVARIEATGDPVVLERWILHASTAESVSEVFAE